MAEHYIVFAKKDIEKGEKILNEAQKKLVEVHDYLTDKTREITKLQNLLKYAQK